ncbi:hypothetical protein PCA10_41670 [Metapseudomonas resinovorans NBRC 106553]|uniref:Uncharacterized protein n=1 Tax=Metapseudomonas resinovorans NBRC 106553 TaxID=1245471 RepID=S6BKU2_METRE|nr:hypothetical protein PCA10_41670 [Pseudomonas resinovorans NBRC 106553]
MIRAFLWVAELAGPVGCAVRTKAQYDLLGARSAPYAGSPRGRGETGSDVDRASSAHQAGLGRAPMVDVKSDIHVMADDSLSPAPLPKDEG